MSKGSGPTLNFTPEDWERVERDTMAWWAGELERPLVYLAAADSFAGPVPRQYLSNYPLDMPVDEVLDQYEAMFSAMHYYGDAFPAWWVNFGPGIAAGFLGARVNSVTEPQETVWFTPSEEKAVDELELGYDPQNAWWRRVCEITTAIVDRWQGQIAVGHTDLGGNLDILASFRKTEPLLYDLIDQPEAVSRLVEQITALWVRYHEELDALIRPACRGTTCWTPLFSTGTTYMLQCDFSYMISPAMFEQFVMPDLVACCDYLDHGFYHLDGKGEIPHLDLLLSIPRLRGIQWIPGDGQPPPQGWLPLLKRIREGDKLCQVFVSPEGARTIVRELGGRGFLLVVHGGPDFADPEQAAAFLKVLESEDISRDS